MSKHDSTQKTLSGSRHISARQYIGIFAISCAIVLLLVCGTSLAISLTTHTHLATTATVTTGNGMSTSVAEAATPSPDNSRNTPQTTATASNAVTATPTPTEPTPAPQSSQVGVFPLSSGGPLPIPQSVFHPTNIARVMLNGTLTSVYAGSLAQSSQIGAFCVLREDLTTGQIAIQMYQSPRPEGPLTILAVQHAVLTFTDTHEQGTFDLSTNTFHW